MARLMHYQLITTRSERDRKMTISCKGKIMCNLKLSLRIRKSLLSEKTFLQLTTKMVNLQNNKCYIQKMHNGAIIKLKLKFSEKTCKSRPYQ